MTPEDFAETAWPRMVRLYKRNHDLPPFCLKLQAAHDLDVVFAIFLRLADLSGLSPTAEDMQRLADHVEDWRLNVVKGLRRVRTWQKPNVQTSEEATLREEIKRIELEAERAELARLTHFMLGISVFEGENQSCRRYLELKDVPAEDVEKFLVTATE